MISQRDMLQFFNIVEILSNPEKVKAELAVLQNLQKDLETREAALVEKQRILASKEATARDIIDNQTAREQDFARRVGAVDAKEQTLSELETKLTKAAQDQKAIAELLNTKAAKLDDRETAVQAREDNAVTKEASINKRTEALIRKETDYTDRMKQLRNVIS